MNASQRAIGKIAVLAFAASLIALTTLPPLFLTVASLFCVTLGLGLVVPISARKVTKAVWCRR